MRHNMNNVRAALASVLLLAMVGCASTTPGFPVNADPQSMEELTGFWEGEYSSKESGRHGNVTFDLSAGADSAVGDVTMLMRPTVARHNDPNAPTGLESQPISRSLTITFIQAANEMISGELDPYEDPDCGCTVQTVFNGRIEGDRIEGTYQSRSKSDGTILARGVWSVKRTKK